MLTTAGIPTIGIGDMVVDVVGASPTASTAVSYLVTIKTPIFMIELLSQLTAFLDSEMAVPRWWQ